MAKQQLETALRSAQRESMLITDSELAEVHYKLGRICWTMGGNELTDPTQARAHLEAATKEDSEIQVCLLNLISCGHWQLHMNNCCPCKHAFGVESGAIAAALWALGDM